MKSRALLVVIGLLVSLGCSSDREEGALASDDGDSSTTDEISQHGITWSFDGEVRFGQYANGDYWVVGPLTIVGITPDFDGAANGWEVNPADVDAQGFDSRIGAFDAARIPDFPYDAAPGESVVKAVSLEPLDDSECRPCVQTAAVLTVVDEVPPDEGRTVFRPPYVGEDKPNYSTDDLRVELLPALAPTESAPSFEDMTEQFQRVWLDHKVGWTGRPLHPSDAMPDYGSDIATRSASGALTLMLEGTTEEKWDALVRYVQVGIDLYHMMLGGTTWPPGGGHGEGRKLPAAFTAVLLDDQEMMDALASSGREVFGENGGMYYSAAADTVLFGQTDNAEDNYWTNLVFDTGSRTIIDPYQLIDGGHRPGGSYQYCCTAMCWKATAAALHLMPELLPVFNHDEFLDYVDRWVDFGAWTQPDACAPPDGVCTGGDNAGATCTSASEPTTCTGDDAACDLTVNWDANYGVTYGPDGSGGCISDQDPSDGTGRFPQLHGTAADEGHHGSGFANEMWTAHVR